MTLNLELLFGIMDNLFKGVNLLIWIVGFGTILAAVIGVSNIMMVSVKERTTEIGIRRAIGATPSVIITQIMEESVLLTLVSGMIGIIVSVGILSIVDKLRLRHGRPVNTSGTRSARRTGPCQESDGNKTCRCDERRIIRKIKHNSI